MTNSPQKWLIVLKTYLWILGLFVLFWWPLSHWFYPQWYHRLLGFETFDSALVTIIGTTGLVVVMNIFFAARDPIRNRAMILVLIIFSVVMAGTYFFLIQTRGFPQREYVNLALLVINTMFLVGLYPRDAWAASVLDGSACPPGVVDGIGGKPSKEITGA